MKTDTELLDWLESQGNGIGIVHDDNLHWAVASSGMQPVVSGDDPPDKDFQTVYFVEFHEWRKTLREAIEAAISAEEESE